jgi:hypothetical protein
MLESRESVGVDPGRRYRSTPYSPVRNPVISSIRSQRRLEVKISVWATGHGRKSIGTFSRRLFRRTVGIQPVRLCLRLSINVGKWQSVSSVGFRSGAGRLMRQNVKVCAVRARGSFSYVLHWHYWKKTKLPNARLHARLLATKLALGARLRLARSRDHPTPYHDAGYSAIAKGTPGDQTEVNKAVMRPSHQKSEPNTIQRLDLSALLYPDLERTFCPVGSGLSSFSNTIEYLFYKL